MHGFECPNERNADYAADAIRPPIVFDAAAELALDARNDDLGTEAILVGLGDHRSVLFMPFEIEVIARYRPVHAQPPGRTGQSAIFRRIGRQFV